MATRDYDFIGFTFNGKHSIDDFGIYRTSNGDRYDEKIVPELNDITAQIPGGDGQYYFRSYYNARQFIIPIAFDSITESQYHEIRLWLKGKEINDLIFDEAPYKVYSAKVVGAPTLKTICFEQGGQRIYKGEGEIQFTCYYPFAHTPIINNSNKDGRSLDNYDISDYPTKDQWKIDSILPAKHVDGDNYGDIPTNFVIKCQTQINKEDVLKVGDLEITILENNIMNLCWDSKSGIVTGKTPEESKDRPIRTLGKTYGVIPVGGVNKKQIFYSSQSEEKTFYVDGTYTTKQGKTGSEKTPRFTIEYNYWYY